MMIKTWEHYEPQETLLTNSPIIKKKKSESPFSIKTLRLYDENSLLVEIMTEQINGEFPDNSFYDTSTLMYKDCIFYFKRICIDRRKVREACNTNL